MKYHSTRDNVPKYSLSKAITLGLAPDGGLFLPEIFPLVTASSDELKALPIEQRIARLLFPFVEEEIPFDAFKEIVTEVFSFPIITRQLNEKISVLELYHGPTLAFKDFGARFLSRLLSYFFHKNPKRCAVLVATSGDTGSAVASAFHNVQGIDVVILYPSGKVSEIQEKQLTTFGGNIQAFEIDGAFDDCQRLVKQAFQDQELNAEMMLTSANSINIARLLPQAIYYIESWLELNAYFNRINFVVPSGNLGNITAGMIARKISGGNYTFTSALNDNWVFEEFLKTGVFNQRASIETLSNAMDVGNPSNLERIRILFSNLSELDGLLNARHYNDEDTLRCMKRVYSEFGIIIDPHTAVGFMAAEDNIRTGSMEHQVVLSTAHPAKFLNTVRMAINSEPDIPPRLKDMICNEKKSVVCSKEYSDFKRTLIQKISGSL